MEQKKNILKAPYKTLPLSTGFKRFMGSHHFGNLEDLLQRHTVNELLALKGFNHRTLKELFQYLEDNGIDKLLKVRQ